METAAFISRLFDVIENDIAPKTREGVRKGNKIFGAAILRKSDLSVVVAETNNETENPLWHGEMHAIKKLYELNRATLPDPKDCIFLATHEPCSLCLSAITWAGYDNFYFLFSHEDSRDSFAIPHDIRILKEVFVPPGAPLDAPLYNTSNAFWTSHSIGRMIATLDRGNREALLSRMDDIGALYADLSATYQQDKGDKGIPLA
ncbi:nucleoside deaminase [Paradevosia shaoguanensis]|uniref:Nucleoside deaminase n=1 Tax=Paradevosia shaoguanensis TaxID=1335043 RepID=A0AA41UCA7_9HYPH|nr:nucleoside deaminase [Paradevosia shaoguanensis]MCF1743657.1 nucleoside deaminase [Paradevosia shaoguanensis]MCI0128140.1 nucleoside deaminase [Paradevosia shaoguanensis]